MNATATIVTEEALLEIVESVWTTTLELPVSLCTEPQYVQNARGLAASVHIVGRWNGTVLYLPSTSFARTAASIMLATPLASVTSEDVFDSAAELCNIVAGNLKSIMPGPSSLSLPTVAEGADYEMQVRRSRLLLRLNVRCQRESLQVLVLESEANAH